MGKQIVVDTHSEVFVSHRKEWSAKTCCNEEEPQRDYAQVKEASHRRSYIVRLHLGKIFGRVRPIQRECRLVVAEG